MLSHHEYNEGMTNNAPCKHMSRDTQRDVPDPIKCD